MWFPSRKPKPSTVQNPSPTRVEQLFEEVTRVVAFDFNVMMVVEDNRIRIPARDSRGPDIAIVAEGQRITLTIGPWYDDFQSTDLIVEYVRWALNGTLRVRVDRMRDRPVCVALELRFPDGSWQEDCAMKFGIPLFRRQAIETFYLQNALRADLGTISPAAARAAAN